MKYFMKSFMILAFIAVALFFTACGDDEDSRPFITTWKTTTAGESITIPVYYSAGTYNYSVDWGDGNSSSALSDDATHIYETAGTYSVKISGTFPAIQFNNFGDKNKIISIDQWGSIAWKTMNRAFYGCTELDCYATDNPDLSRVTDMSYMFANATTFNSDLNDWDVSNVKNMSYMFYNAAGFHGDISDWVVSSVINMKAMFSGAIWFNCDLSNWDVSNVKSMDWMFYKADDFNSNISGWTVSSVTNMCYMFSDATAFNSDLNNWDVSNVINMSAMFSDATTFNSDISDWTVSSVVYMGSMFSYTSSFNSSISNWNVSNVINMDSMFYEASAFSGHNLTNWNVAQVTTHILFSLYSGTGNTEPIWP